MSTKHSVWSSPQYGHDNTVSFGNDTSETRFFLLTVISCPLSIFLARSFFVIGSLLYGKKIGNGGSKLTNNWKI